MYFKDPSEVQSNNILTRTYVMRKDDIAFEGHPSKKYKFGRFVANDIGDGIVSELFPVYRHISKYDPKYWKYAIQIERIMAPLFAKSITSSGNSSNKLNPKHFLRQKVRVPNVKEQSKIGEFFSKLDSTITLHEEKQRQLEQLKKALLQKMFVDKSGYPELGFKGFADIWEQRQLGEIGSTFSGLSGKNKEDFGHGNARFITYMNVYSNPIANPKGTEHIEIDPKQHQVKFGDILFTTSSETPEEVGMSSVWLSNDENVYLNSFCFGYRVLSNQKINPYYMAYLLRSDSFRRKVTLLAQGISRYNISKKHVMGISISFPALEEQKKVGRLFQKLDQTITFHAKKIEQLKQLKQALLQKMFV